MPLELKDKAALFVFLELGQVLVKSRDFLSVAKADIRKVGSVVVLEIHSVYLAVVINHKFAVLGHIDIELTSPETEVLSCCKGCDGVVGSSALLALPITAMRNNTYLMLFFT